MSLKDQVEEYVASELTARGLTPAEYAGAWGVESQEEGAVHRHYGVVGGEIVGELIEQDGACRRDSKNGGEMVPVADPKVALAGDIMSGLRRVIARKHFDHLDPGDWLRMSVK